MKKKYLIVCLIGVVSLLSSCASTRSWVFDENSPREDNATITFVHKGYFTIKEWNGINVRDSLYPGTTWRSKYDKCVLVVPPGNNNFLFNVYYEVSSQLTVYFENISMQYNLEAGKKYEVRGRTTGFFTLTYYLGLYDVTSKKAELIREWQIGSR
jgi:hypothetical protein